MSVQKKANGRWLARWIVDGRQVGRTFDRRADALAWEAELRLRGQLGVHGPGQPSRESLETWLKTWWTRESPRWARSTRLQRAAVADRWIIPYAGGVRLSSLGVARVSEWRAEIVAAGCPPTQANAALSVLSASLGVAVAHGALPANPCRAVRRLPVTRTRPRALTPLEVERIRGRMTTLRDVALVGLLAYAGLRPEEAFALTWGSVGGVLVVDRSFTAGELKQTKTGKRRTVEILPPVAEDLERLRPRVSDPDELVAPGRTGSPLDLRNWRWRVWRPACEDAGVRARPYDLRHTYASLLIHEGRSVPYVAAALGHASARMTLEHYTHLFDAARLAPAVSMVPAIEAARAEVRRDGLHPRCTEGSISVLRTRTPGAAKGRR